jgi:hypothetical protein
LCGDNTTLTKSVVQELKVGFLEEGLGGAFRVAGVGDDDVEFVGVVLKVLEAVTNDGVDVRVLETDGHGREVLLGETDDSLTSFNTGRH